MTIRRTDPTGQFNDGAAAIVAGETIAAQQAAFAKQFPADVNGLKDLSWKAVSLARRAANCST